MQNANASQNSLMREVKLRFGWPGLEPEVVPLRLLPGLPRILKLSDGSPFTASEVCDSCRRDVKSTVP